MEYQNKMIIREKRELRFRVWDKDASRWLYGSNLYPSYQRADNLPLDVLFNILSDSAIIDSSTVGQYIGEKDKNKVRIFEGDILLTDEANWKALVVYEGASFWLRDLRGGFSLEPNWNKCKVIGNIFENPYLLEEKLKQPKNGKFSKKN